MNARKADERAVEDTKEISENLQRVVRIAEFTIKAQRHLEQALPHERFYMTSSGQTTEGARAVDRLSDSIEINQAIVLSVTAIVVSDNGTIIGATPAADMMFGYAIGELKGSAMSVHDLVPPDQREAHKNYFEMFWKKPEARQMGTREMKLQGITRDGTLFPVEVGWGSPIFVLNQRAVVASIMRVENGHGDSGIHSP